MTIKEAIVEVMRRRGRPMTAREAYDDIVSAGLYKFKAADPFAIVSGTIRRHCIGIDFPSASSKKHFKLIDSKTFWFIEESEGQTHTLVACKKKRSNPSSLGIDTIKEAQRKHTIEFKLGILKQLKKMPPENFEVFTKNLLEVYGFEDVCVTKYSKDGGIDGYGRLKIGFGHMGVAFQCKRYSSKKISTKEIQAFRGAIQGKYDQGLFFTTSAYSKECERLMFQAGAVPIIMIDGNGIVDIMIEKEFGVQTEEIPVYINALDLALSEL